MADTDLGDRMAAALREHYLNTSSPEQTADGGLPCSCGTWWEGTVESTDDESDWASHLADAALHVAQTDLDRVAAEREGVYRERAQLLAHLAAIHESHIAYTDPDVPTWPVLTVETPTGQMCWHINPTDLDLFGHVTWVDPVAIGWDGHTTEEKYQRLRELTSQDSAERLRRERATCRRCNTGDHDPCGQHLGAS